MGRPEAVLCGQGIPAPAVVLAIDAEFAGAFAGLSETVEFFPVAGVESDQRISGGRLADGIDYSGRFARAGGESACDAIESTLGGDTGCLDEPEAVAHRAARTVLWLIFEPPDSVIESLRVVRALDKRYARVGTDHTCGLKTTVVFSGGKNIRIVEEAGEIMPAREPLDHHRGAGPAAYMEED